jgi:hypothetical protein
MFLPNRHQPWVRILFISIAILLFMLGYQWGNGYLPPPSEPPRIGGVLIRPATILPDFQLQDSFGRVIERKTLETGWSLLAFGDLARASGQLAVQRLIDVGNHVADQTELRQALRLLLITTTETPNLARDFAHLSTSLSILGGEAARIDSLRNALSSRDDDAPTLYVIGPGAHLLALLTETQDGTAMAEDLKALFISTTPRRPDTP